ncbi:MAG: PEP-CTERM sorting domain-containing protein, partial [Thermoguttaceae bacterium]
NAILYSGNKFDTFRSTITGLGDSIVPKSSFIPSDLVGIDGLIVKISYSQDEHPYSPAEMIAIQALAQRAVFVSDSSLWADADSGSDRPITFGDNSRLLTNCINYISTGGVLFIADGGDGFDVQNFNSLVAPFGISFASSPTDGTGRTVQGFVLHPVTEGVNTVGVDYQLPITVASPALDLTLGDGNDNILAVYSIPEPSAIVMLGIGAIELLTFAWRRRK